MHTETIQLPHGYTAEICTDADAENPFEAWECEPPIAVLNWQRFGARLENYGGPELTLQTLLALVPDSTWESRQGKRKLRDALPFELADVLAEMIETRSFRGALENLVDGLSPSGWREWVEYFDSMHRLAFVLGIPCHYTQSNGYSQGDSALVFVAALPSWVEKSGVEPKNQEAACKSAANLWSAWAWGDVFGVDAIRNVEGKEIDGVSCWGFYGTDHESSGLLDHCRDVVREDMRERARESAAAFEAACRDISTIPAFA